MLKLGVTNIRLSFVLGYWYTASKSLEYKSIFCSNEATLGRFRVRADHHEDQGTIREMELSGPLSDIILSFSGLQ